MSLDLAQLRELVVVPALRFVGLHSKARENLVLGTAVVESRCQYLKQLGSGPALGLWQMEPATYADLWENYIRYRHSLAGKLNSMRSGLHTAASLRERAAELIGNLPYAAAMCGVHYLRAPAPLPNEDDPKGMARYWKQYYNTPLGKGTAEKALPAFEEACR